jgi:uncharacterized Zn-binding protein involved in type VI secretion
MSSVAVNPPKTPVTKGSSGIAAATLPNICKMPGPPAPFVPTPLPNIGQSGKQPDGYSTTVKVEGEFVAIAGASFGSSGDIASKGTGGGIVSNNAEGPTKFIAPGSLNVQIEGKNVQYLGDQTLNNCGPGGSPANSATMTGTVQAPALAAVTEQALRDLAKACNDHVNGEKKPKGKACTKAGTKKHKCCEDAINDYKKNNPGEADKIESEVPYKKNADDTYTRIDKASDDSARGLANQAYQAAKAGGGPTKGVWAKAYFGAGGASFKADVLMTDSNGVKRAFDFKFNCKSKAGIGKKQRDKYKAATGLNPTPIHVPGHL